MEEKQINIVIVDDNIQLLKIYGRILKRLGLTYKMIETRKQLKEFFTQSRMEPIDIDVIYIDYGFIKDDTKILLTDICDRWPQSIIKIISGTSSSILKKQLSPYKIDEILHKPFNTLEEFQKIKNYIKKQRHSSI